MIQSCGLSDPGKRREVNQDRFRADDEIEFYQVADGMGGHAAGEEAAAITVETIHDFVTLASQCREITWPFGYDIRCPFEHNVMKTAVLLANRQVLNASNRSRQFLGMGSTVVSLWIKNGVAWHAHVGDSRLYLMRDGSLTQLTLDHSLVNEQLQSGIITPDEVRDHSLRHVVTRAIGMQDAVDADVSNIPLVAGDILLLCSDGLTDELEPEEIAALLRGSSNFGDCCRTLIDAANAAGGRDNVTVVLALYGG